MPYVFILQAKIFDKLYFSRAELSKPAIAQYRSFVRRHRNVKIETSGRGNVKQGLVFFLDVSKSRNAGKSGLDSKSSPD